MSVALSQTKCKTAGLPFVPNSLYLTCLLGLRYWIVFNWLIPQLFSIELRVTQDSRKNAKNAWVPFAPYSLPGFPAETGSASTGVATLLRLRGPG